MTKQPHVVLLCQYLGFPNGMASTQRAGLIVRSLVKQGVRVSILCTTASERLSDIQNIESMGEYYGIPFEYTTGSPIVNHSVVGRTFASARSLLILTLRLAKWRRNGDLTAIYLYGNSLSCSLMRPLLVALASRFNVPLIVELCERPWSLKCKPSFLERHFSVLTGCKGAIVISDMLEHWAVAESAKRCKNVDILRLPILVDIAEYQVAPLVDRPTVLFAGATGYTQSVKFILDSMNRVWQDRPECKLLITGADWNSPVGLKLKEEIDNKNYIGHVDMLGFVARHELLRICASAWVLLAPLHNDLRSKARFPTKIGEYLAAGRPVVSNTVGEVEQYLEDGVSAFLCEPDDPEKYGKKILEAINDPQKALEVGARGRQVAQENFDYIRHGTRLANFFTSLVD